MTMLLLLLGLLTFPLLAMADITSNLYGHWSFNQYPSFLADDSGNGRNGTAYGYARAAWEKGFFEGNTLELNYNNLYTTPSTHSTSNNDYAGISSVHGALDGSYTLAIYVYPTAPIVGSGSANDGGAGIMLWGYSYLNGLYIDENDKMNCAHTVSNGTRYTATSSATLSARRWYAVACTVDKVNGVVKLYVDGTLENTQYFNSNTAAWDQSSEPLKLGILGAGASSWRWMFDGRLDDARLYSRALSQSDVQQLMGEASAYPGPSASTYHSSAYTVKVRQNPYYGSWNETYTYAFSRGSVTNWYNGTSPTGHIAISESTGGTYYEITKAGGNINNYEIKPHSNNTVAFLSSGKLYLWSGGQLRNLWVVLDYDNSNPLMLYSHKPYACPSSGATGYSTSPGIYNMGHYVASNNELICLNPGVVQRGNYDLRNKSNVTIYGPGIVVGDYWTAEDVQALSFEDTKPYWMVSAEFSSNTYVDYATFVMSPSYNMRGVSSAYGTRLFSPWYYSTDGYYVGTLNNAFAFVGDNALISAWANYGCVQDTYAVNSTLGSSNNSVINGGYRGVSLEHPIDPELPGCQSYLSWNENLDIVHHDNWVNDGNDSPTILGLWVDNPDQGGGYSNRGFANQYYNGIRAEWSSSHRAISIKHKDYPWDGITRTPYGQIRNIYIRDMVLEGTQGASSEIMGLDANNTTTDWLVEGLVINGTPVTQYNYWSYITTGSYSSGTILP